MTNIESLEEKVLMHDKQIAVLEQISTSIDRSLENLSSKFDKQYEAYMEMQGTLKIVMDIREFLQKSIDDHENRIRNNESFISNLKGRIAAYAGLGGLAGGIFAGVAANFMNK